MLWISLINAYHVIFKNEKTIHGHESLMKIRAECFDLLPDIYDIKYLNCGPDRKFFSYI